MSDNSTNKRFFEINNKKYYVQEPTTEVSAEARKLKAKIWKEAFQNGDLLRDQLDDELRKRKLWNDERELQFQTLKKKVQDSEYLLEAGGIKLSEARAIALEMNKNREEMIQMLSSRSEIDSQTCEGQADAAFFNYLVSECSFTEDGKKVFENLDKYLSGQAGELSAKCGQEYYYLVSGFDGDESNRNLPENKFLSKFKFVDKNMNLVDRDGKKVDEAGHHIDDFGNKIEWLEDGNSVRVDDQGRHMDEQGRFKVPHAPFLDDQGNPIDEDSFGQEKSEQKDPPKPKPKRKRKTETQETKGVSDSVDA